MNIDKNSWIVDYLNGLQCEIYRIKLDADTYVGISFDIVSQFLYQ